MDSIKTSLCTCIHQRQRGPPRKDEHSGRPAWHGTACHRAVPPQSIGPGRRPRHGLPGHFPCQAGPMSTAYLADRAGPRPTKCQAASRERERGDRGRPEGRHAARAGGDHLRPCPSPQQSRRPDPSTERPDPQRRRLDPRGRRRLGAGQRRRGDGYWRAPSRSGEDGHRHWRMLHSKRWRPSALDASARSCRRGGRGGGRAAEEAIGRGVSGEVRGRGLEGGVSSVEEAAARCGCWLPLLACSTDRGGSGLATCTGDGASREKRSRAAWVGEKWDRVAWGTWAISMPRASTKPCTNLRSMPCHLVGLSSGLVP